MKRVFLGLLVTIVAAPNVARAEGDAPTAADRVLGGVEWKANPTSVRQLGLHADTQLVDLCNDPNTTPMRRRRAIAMMEYTSTPAVQTFLRDRFAKLRDAKEGTDALELAALLPVIARLHLVDFASVSPLLAHAVANVRESAAVAMHAIDLKRARVALRTRMLTETDSGVRQRLGRLMETP